MSFNLIENIYLIGDIMKKKIYILLVFLTSLCIFNVINTKAKELPLTNKTIYLDPGHGGKDPGSIYKNIYEKDINLSICLKLKEELEKSGAKVLLTRNSDYDLSTPNARLRKKSDLNNRAKLINESNVDMYISIHLNSTNSTTWHGAQVFYDDVNKENKNIATIMQEEFKKNLNTNREIEKISDMLLNRKVVIPGILIEAGFLSNSNDRYLLLKEEYQIKLSTIITNGIIKYYQK